jgi:DNA-binding GntR family transcriptional regulator
MDQAAGANSDPLCRTIESRFTYANTDEEGVMAVDLKVTPQSVLFQTTSKLREAIMQGQFAPGERLVETTLAEMMGVSRTTLREALRRLETERLVHNAPNRGPSVATISAQETAEIYHVRKLLEGEAAALFAVAATGDEIDRLDRALSRFSDAVQHENALARLESTSEFYDVILHGCGNHIIREFLESLFARVNLLRAKSMSNPGRAQFSLLEMARIRDAVKAHDAVAARAAAEAHVLAAQQAAQHPEEPDGPKAAKATRARSRSATPA